jgi:hypothetical protein
MMIGPVFNKILLALGVRKAPPALRDSATAHDDDFVARHGLSYGEAADPISKEGHLQIERLKSLPRIRR